jgi:hypothetical protein
LVRVSADSKPHNSKTQFVFLVGKLKRKGKRKTKGKKLIMEEECSHDVVL